MIEKHTPVLKIIKVGTLCLEASEMASTFNLQIKSDLGIGGGSTVTLIDSEQRILVDTGFDYEWRNDADNRKSNARNLRRALHDQGIAPDDIQVVFITHWHRDHFGNLRIFKKARFLASQLLVGHFALKDFTGLSDGEELANGVRVLLTPGHTAEHASIVVDSRLGGVNARIAIAGDAVISPSYFQTGRIWQQNADFYDINEARKSNDRLIRSSDLIIPGHGVPFLVK